MNTKIKTNITLIKTNRHLLSISILLSFFLTTWALHKIVEPPTTFARQPKIGHFNCEWENGSCVVSEENCEDGYEPDPSICEQLIEMECSNSDWHCKLSDSNPSPAHCGECTPGTSGCGQNEKCVVTFGSVTCPPGTGLCAPDGVECTRDWHCDQNEICSDTANICVSPPTVPDHYIPPEYDWAVDVTYKCEWHGHPGTQIKVSELGGPSSTCVPITADGIANWVLYYAARIAGGIAFALLLYGGILFITSQGDEEKVEQAQKTITSAITGLLVITFATLILRIIGYDILGLPGWAPSGPDIKLPGDT